MGTWNFWESGHGKGAPDGIGAVIKRKSDEMVTTKQRDVLKASDIVTGMADIETGKIKCFEVHAGSIETIEKEIPQKIKQVPNTMKIHQVVTTEKLHIRSRALSCFGTDGCPFNYTCFTPEVTSFELENTSARSSLQTEKNHDEPEKTSEDLLRPVTNIDESLVGRYCMVFYVYDQQVYPGVILSVDEEELEIKTMSRIGHNRWFWPMRDDILWYNKENVVTLLEEEPQYNTKRHHKINDNMWASIEKAID